MARSPSRARIASLKAQLASQSEEMGNLKEQNDALTQSYDNQGTTCRWTGSSAVVPWWGGILLGILLPMLPRRRSRGDRWMN